MKLLWVGNAPWTATGYGQQASQFLPRIAEHYPVAVASNYGIHGNKTKWQGIDVFPAGYDAYSNDIIPSHADFWLEGEPGDGWMFTLMDVWVFKNPRFQRFNVASWVPIDHLPIPPAVAGWLRDNFVVPIAMSKFGQTQLERAGFDPYYIPHGIDTATYKPGNKREARELLGLPEDAFIVTMNAANKGRAVIRKSFDKVFEAFSVLARNRDDAILYLHTEQLGLGDGINLAALAEGCGIPEDRVYWVDQYAYRMGLSADVVAATYQASDVLAAPSRGEGFGIPVIEAQACGLPAIVSNFSAQPELVADGWYVDGEPEYDGAQQSWFFFPYSASVYDALTDAYDRRSDTPSDKAVAHAAQYDTAQVWADHFHPTLQALEARTPTCAPLDVPPMREAS